MKKNRVGVSSLLVFTVWISSFAQQPLPSPTPKPSPSTPQAKAPQETSDDDVVRITSNLVQVDAVVTDGKDRHITDLTDQDFEIFEDGRPQKITNLSYVSIKSPAAVTPPPTVAKTKEAVALPPATIRPEAVQRTIALVVDDLELSFESTVFVRQALKKFVDEQMHEGDLVAIIRTRGGTGPLQQFTADKRLLYAAIDRIRWNPSSGSGLIGAFAPLDLDPLTKLKARAAAAMPGSGGGLAAAPGAASGPGPGVTPTERLEEFRKDVFSVGTVGALKFVVQGMQSLPGRKAVILMSDGLEIFKFMRDEGSGSVSDSGSNRVLDSLRQLTDFANRASVVIYTMDARGLQTLGMAANDNTDDQTTNGVLSGLTNRRNEYIDSQQGLNYLSKQTGGFLIHDTNDLAAGIERVLDDQKGYYLIGYRPDDSTFNAEGRRNFHRISVRVKRSGLKVRARTGFYGVTEEETRLAAKNKPERIVEALLSPFSSADVHLRMTTLFGSDERHQPVMRALLHIDGKDLTFTESADGWRQLSFEVLAVTFGDGGVIVNKFGRTETMRVREDAYRQAQSHGLIYTLNVPLQKTGAYQLRIAIRVAGSERIGAASQFIEVPNLKTGQLALSGIVLAGLNHPDTPATKQIGSTAQDPTKGEQEAWKPESEVQANPAVRRMHMGMLLNFAYSIYNAKMDKRTKQPQLQTQVRLFRGSQLVYTGKITPLNVGPQSDPKPIPALGTFQLGADEKPGDYFLQVVVTDLLADKKRNTTVSWIDFEILE